jgi:hypothetical protein
LKKGEAYSFTRHQTTVAEKVRVAVAPGTHQFMIERDGQLVEVRVEADKVTPVEIDYVIYDRADNYVIYRVDYQTFEPMPLKAKSG